MKASRVGCVLALALAVAIAVGFSQAKAEIVTFNFTGTVTSVYNPYGVISPGLITVGDPVQTSLRYDTTSPDGYPGDPTWGAFVSPGWLTMNFNGLVFGRTTSVRVDILNNGNGGQHLFQAMAQGGATVWPVELPSYAMQDIMTLFWETAPPYDLLSSDQLPTSMDFSRADMSYGFVRASNATFANMYEIQFSLQQVPEPGAGSLLAGGLILWFWRRIVASRSPAAN